MANWLERVFRRNDEIDWMYDWDILQDKSERLYLKQLAIQICVNHISDTISQSNFIVKTEDKKFKTNIEYLLNVRPNKNQNASQFWQNLIFQLINNNEVLIIKTDTDDLIIADDFDKTESVLYDTVFKNVQAQEFTFDRAFYMSDVFYLQYSNGKMKDIIEGLFDDYSEVFSRLLKFQLHSHQIRATFRIGATGRKDFDTKDKFQTYVEKVTDSFNKNDIAIVPLLDGHEYSEHGNNTTNKSVNEINHVLNGFIDKVAMALRIPTNLLYGEMADTKQATRNYMKFCVNPLIKQIENEFTSKLFERSEIESKDSVIEIRPITLENLFERAEAIDKLISSGAFTRNEIRELAGAKRIDDKELDRFIITKNYRYQEEADETSKGGE